MSMITLQPYGLLIALSAVVAYFVARRRLKSYQLTTDQLDQLFLLIIPLAVVGARLYHVLDKFSYYLQNPLEIIAVWNGGLGIYGAVAGGILGIWIFTRSKKQESRIKILDFLVPSVAIAQAIGRWGNFFNQEVFGGPTKLPWGWYIPPSFRPGFWQNYSYFHPTFAYESFWTLTGFLILLILEKKFYFNTPAAKGQKFSFGLLTGFYCAWYGAGRFVLEFLRFDTAEVGGVKVAQIISLGLILIGIWLMRRASKRFV